MLLAAAHHEQVDGKHNQDNPGKANPHPRAANSFHVRFPCQRLNDSVSRLAFAVEVASLRPEKFVPVGAPLPDPRGPRRDR